MARGKRKTRREATRDTYRPAPDYEGRGEHMCV